MDYLTYPYANLQVEGSSGGAVSGIITVIIEILKGVGGKGFIPVRSNSIAKFNLPRL